MTRRRKYWLIGILSAFTAVLVGVLIAGYHASRKFEPFIREQAILYLEERFGSDVQLQSLRIRVPKLSPLQSLLTKGRGVVARVEGEGLRLNQKGVTADLPALISIRKFGFAVDLGAVMNEPRTVESVWLQGVEVNVPPKDERKPITASSGSGKTSVLIDEVNMDDLVLNLLPKDRSKRPLRFAIHRLRLESAGTGVPMKYRAHLTNPKPKGTIYSIGSFGPWVAEDLGLTPLNGDYKFENADLSIFRSIAGILQSTGSFSGNLSTIEAKGEARVPDFRLAMAGNSVPLVTRFEVLVDGTNGNTILKPVRATLGSTYFTTSGGVIRHDGDRRRTLELQVNMPNGHLRDVLRLAMKGTPFMEGRLALNTKIELPPLDETVREKLILDGRFEVKNGLFLKSNIQDQIDTLSRRGQGQPKNTEVDEVVANMRGQFHLENERLTFRSLSFQVPGAAVDLAGAYDLERDNLDFTGALKLQAKVSQTMTGWKRWALKPVDPFFAKNGAGTFLRIAVTGSSRKPEFGRAKGRER